MIKILKFPKRIISPLLKSVELYEDSTLVSRLKGGDEDAFRLLYNKYKDKLIFFCIGITKSRGVSEEIIQDVFVKVWLVKDQLDPSRAFSSFLYTLTRNSAINHLKKVAVEERSVKELWRNISEGKNFTEELFFSNELDHLKEKAVAILPQQKQLVFDMCKIQNLTYQQAADRLGISKNTVRNHLAEAIKMIKTYLIVNSDITFFIALIFLF